MAGRIVGSDPDELADLLVILGQGVNNPLLLGAPDRARLVGHLTTAIVAVLAPEA